MDLSVLIETLSLIAVTEFGDKSMFTTITLATQYERRSVFLGAFLALSIVSIIGAVLGVTVAEIIGPSVIRPFAALVFLLFGIYMLVANKRNDKTAEGPIISSEKGSGFLTAFLLLMMMEIGDKSQIAVFTLAAASGELLAVILGSLLAFLPIISAEAYLGDKLCNYISTDTMRWIAGAVFILFGIIYAVQWLI